MSQISKKDAQPTPVRTRKINITLSDSEFNILTGMAKLLDTPRENLLGELLRNSIPTLHESIKRSL